MSKWIAGTCVVMSAGLIGCATSGLSSRETAGRNHGTYVRALYDLPTTRDAEARPFSGPAKLAVVQVGEVSPEAVLLDRLRKEAGTFTRVEAISDSGGDTQYLRRDPYNRDPQLDNAKSRVEVCTNVARDMGMDYLLLVGGTIDSEKNATPLSILNLTIIGAFIIPSDQTRAEVKASGALVDLRSGRVVSISTAQVQGGHLTPPISTQGEQVALFKKLRTQVTAKLADQVLADCKGGKTETAAVMK